VSEDDRGRFGVVDAVGVDPARRGQGLARVMLEDVLDHARAAGLAEVRSLIAGNNTGSLALHRAAGFVETGRRQMYDRALPTAG
jgi:phosphinothricin acetyltransferase